MLVPSHAFLSPPTITTSQYMVLSPPTISTHHHHHQPPLLHGINTTITATIKMPQPPHHPSATAATTTRIQQITHLLEHRKTRVASLKLLALAKDTPFLDYHLASGSDMFLLRQAGDLFHCLMSMPYPYTYTCGFSRDVDRAVTKLLLHATKGCERRRQRQQQHVQSQNDRLYWLLPEDTEVKGLLDLYRGFLFFILCQYEYQHRHRFDCASTASSPPTAVRDHCLVEVRQRLQRLCPKISDLGSPSSSWSPRPGSSSALGGAMGGLWEEEETSKTKTTSRRPRLNRRPGRVGPKGGVTKAVAAVPKAANNGGRGAKKLLRGLETYAGKETGLITPPTSIPTRTMGRDDDPREENVCLTVATAKLPEGWYLPPTKLSTPAPTPPKVRMVDGMLEEVTQPSTSVDIRRHSDGDAMVIDEVDMQVEGEHADWKERHLRPLLMLSPEATQDRMMLVR